MSFSASPIMLGNTLVLNSIDGNGTKWRVTKFDGWLGSSDPTLEPVQKTRQSGATVGDSFSTGRTMTISGVITSLTADQHSADWDLLVQSVPRSQTLMQVIESGRMRWCMVQRSAAIVSSKFNNRMSGFTIQVFAKDWRKFGDRLTGSTFLPSTTGGFSYPLALPYAIGAVSTSGQVTLTNTGNELGPVFAKIVGPFVGPVITHQGSKQALTFSSSLSMGAGEWLDIDMEKRTVLANGQASRNGFITNRGWSGFEPGDNTWSFDADTYDSASQLIINATPSWE